MSKLGVLIATEEGFFIPGSLPNRNNNPGDLLHSPHSFHRPGDPNSVGIIPTKSEGWADLNRQLQEFADRKLTLEQMVAIYAPEPVNNTAAYLAFLVNGLGVPSTTTVAQALTIPWEPA
jgi:hypothetical protein